MFRKPVVSILLVLSALTLAGIASLAAAGRHGIVLSQDGRTVITKQSPSHITPFVEPVALTTIAGNLSKYPNGVYFCCYGNTISGPNSALGTAYWAAIPFTPTADTSVRAIEVSVGYIEGANGVTISLNADASGVPGAQIAGGDVLGLQPYGDCCQLAVAKGRGGVPVNAGTQYWVVVSTSSNLSTAFDAWAFNSTDMRALPIAFYSSSSGVWGASQSLLPGYAVLGN